MSAAEKALRDDEANALFDGLENLPGLILAVSGGPDSTALLLIAARWAETLKSAAQTTRAKTPCGDGRPRPAAASRGRGLGGEAPGAPPRRAASHAALARQEARHRAARGGALRALWIARASGRASRLWPHPHRPHPRRSGGDGAVSPLPRQRARGACRHGPRRAASRRRRRLRSPASVSHGRQGAPDRDARSRRHRF